MATDFRRLVDALARANVEFVIVGGVAVVAHGHVRATGDLDVCYARTEQNFERLARALAPFRPWLRGAPRELPFTLDAQAIRNGLNFTLTTEIGDVDLLGELTGVGGYDRVVHDAGQLDLYGHAVRVASLDVLERNKLAVGRAKDLLDIEAIAEIRKRRGSAEDSRATPRRER
jgi:hypothetical protein